MKTIITIAAVLFLIRGCNEKNEPGFDTKPLNEQLLGRWRLFFETRSTSYENFRYIYALLAIILTSFVNCSNTILAESHTFGCFTSMSVSAEVRCIQDA
jgi:hypothetical protein